MLSKSDLIEYCQSLEHDLDVCASSNIELKMMYQEIKERYRKLVLRKLK